MFKIHNNYIPQSPQNKKKLSEKVFIAFCFSDVILVATSAFFYRCIVIWLI